MSGEISRFYRCKHLDLEMLNPDRLDGKVNTHTHTHTRELTQLHVSCRAQITEGGQAAGPLRG